VTSRDTQTVSSASLVMEPAAWCARVPLALASLLTALVQSPGSTWGLVRHYWGAVQTPDHRGCHHRVAADMETFRVMAAPPKLTRRQSSGRGARAQLMIFVLMRLAALMAPWPVGWHRRSVAA
jgi:hypothetical protein